MGNGYSRNKERDALLGKYDDIENVDNVAKPLHDKIIESKKYARTVETLTTKELCK